ncbi:deoxyribonuclease IV [candidate division KSB1 bacterium]|nr:MAG: deoxyribonuclease IV [candidate division KSB1 bacterium]
MLIGAHVSVAGGLVEAFRRAEEFDCECIQIFTKSQLQWSAKPLEPDEVYKWLVTWEESGWPPCFVHDSYLINLSSPDEALRRKSVDAFADELERAALLGIPWVNMHPGSHKGAGEEIGLTNCVRSLKEVLERTAGLGVGILLETTAGQGNDIGSRFEHLSHLLEKVNQPERMGVCLDTCHAFAAGYDLRTPEAYAATWKRFEEIIGIKFLHAFHLNDCRYPLGSRRDRHAEIGKGEIGLEAFRMLMNDPRFEGHPGITELPDEVTPRSHKLLKSLRK